MEQTENRTSICIGVGENNIKAIETNELLEKCGYKTNLFIGNFDKYNIFKILKQPTDELIVCFFGPCNVHHANGCDFFHMCMPGFTRYKLASHTLMVENIAFRSKNYSRCLIFIESLEITNTKYQPLRCISKPLKKNIENPKTIVSFNFGENPINIQNFLKQNISLDNVIADENTLLIGEKTPIPCKYPYEFQVDVHKDHQDLWNFLNAKDLEEYYDLFVAHEIRNIQDLTKINRASLKAMQLKLGPRVRIREVLKIDFKTEIL